MQRFTGSVLVWLLAGPIKAIGQMCVHGPFSNIQSKIHYNTLVSMAVLTHVALFSFSGNIENPC